MVRCKTCGRTQRVVDADFNHSWQHQQCSKCHYFGIGKHDRTNNHSGRLGKRRDRTNFKGEKQFKDKIPKHKVIVTEKNIDLYCKISQIIRGKPCTNKDRVLNTQSNGIVRKPVIP